MNTRSMSHDDIYTLTEFINDNYQWIYQNFADLAYAYSIEVPY